MQSAVSSNIARPGSSVHNPSQWSYTVPGVMIPRASARVTLPLASLPAGLGERGRAVAARSFSVEAMVDAYEALYGLT
jgi:hypothetical protein